MTYACFVDCLLTVADFYLDLLTKETYFVDCFLIVAGLNHDFPQYCIMRLLT